MGWAVALVLMNKCNKTSPKSGSACSKSKDLVQLDSFKSREWVQENGEQLTQHRNIKVRAPTFFFFFF